MDIEEYKAGRFEKGFNYSYFVPELINRQWEWKDPQLGTLLERASISMGELNSFARLVPNIDLFIQLHVTKEAVISSRIEGTQTNIDEALMPEDEISPERRNDWLEVRNYSEAMKNAINELEQLPLSSRLLCKTHERLLSGVRGEHKMPGEFRRSQNWIGGASLSDAIFIPPAEAYVNELMGDLEKFLHNENIHVPALVRIGIAHYQFETIHPFLDGNGRIGRLLITLYLVSQKILHQPLLYLSAFFERNKSLYYDNLTHVREKGDLMHWLKYFLTGVDETARQSSNTLSDILKLKAQFENALCTEAGRRTHSALVLLSHLFRGPVISVKQAKVICDLSTKAANDLVSLFVQQGILKEISGKTRYRLFIFAPYLDLFK
ncbi:MAG: cell filamentation protein Fic [Thermodesulfovibrio sp.]|nr:cell filamentation protein Fic [Thermodesulfovibrio sp.]